MNDNPIKTARIAAGYSVREFAALVSVSTSSLFEYESGTAIPRADALARIADALHTTMDKLRYF